MPFSDFHGNTETVTRVREMVQRGRLPHAIIIAGPRGAGKYKLAQMMAKVVNCLSPRTSDGLPDFCGECANCVRIGEADDLDAACAQASKARDEMTAAEQKDTRLLIQTHPDALVIPPDPPQMMIKVGQVRRVIETIYYRPGEARERIYIFTDSAFMKEAANSLLKVLEEPPEFATIFLLTENTGELLPTIRSRAITLTLAALPASDVEDYLASERPQLAPKQRALVARLSGRAIGAARSFDLETYIEARKDALTLLSSATTSDHSTLFRTTETYRAGAEGKEKTEQLVHTMYLLLEDMLFVKSGTEDLVRNTDVLGEIKRLAAGVDFDWIASATAGLGEVESGMRRNLLRSLSLDAFAAALER
ncbi:MAG: DNA polymerase III subunit delta' [Acidobacteria bacterium]|nr:DNA polymerase III subunit delta' [Acidobacteriota bacterium]